MRILPRTILATAIAAGLAAAPASAQQSGLVNVNIEDIHTDISDVLSHNNINVNLPIAATVQIPIGLAANICGTTVAVLSATNTNPVCAAKSEHTTRGQAVAVARAIQRQERD